MTRTALALLAAVLLAACSPEPTASAGSSDAAPAAAPQLVRDELTAITIWQSTWRN